MDCLETKLKEEMRKYRSILQKITRIKTKILCALREEECLEAADNVVEYDLAQYKDLVKSLGKASTNVKSTLDEFPDNADQHSNDRFNTARRTRDVQNEEKQSLVIERFLRRHQEQYMLMTDVLSDNEEVPDEAANMGEPEVSTA